MMKVEHVAIWTDQLENLKDYYERFFEAAAGEKYINPKTGFESYFLSFDTGSRLELKSMPGIPDNANDTIERQHKGIIHICFGLASKEEVDGKARELVAAGYAVLRGPRTTGDGYYEFETADPDKNRLEVGSKA